MLARVLCFLGLITVLAPLPAGAAGSCDDGGAHGPAVAAARAAVRAGCDCEGIPSHADYVRCAWTVAQRLAGDGALPRSCRGRVRQFASRSTCGRDGVVACCRRTATGPWRAALRRADQGCRPPQNGGACEATLPHLDDACERGSGCRSTRCGDGILDRASGEVCEPPGVGQCDDRCQQLPCGNGVVDRIGGEQCEPPGTATCDADCQFIHTCGNGIVELGEECDGQPSCEGCVLKRALCCDLGNACFGGADAGDLDEYYFTRACSYLIGGTTSYAVCEGEIPCPPPAPQDLGCRIGSCRDRAIEPFPLCCQHPDGSCSDTIATTAGATRDCGVQSFPPAPEDIVESLIVGRCGADGRCVPLGATR